MAASKISLLIMDVDGTLTDGMIYVGETGELFKAFNVKDGLGISTLLPKANIKPAIITGRESAMLEKRCAHLGINELHQNATDKLEVMREMIGRLNTPLGEVAYIGDDLNDLPCMIAIKEAGGLVGCTADATSDVMAQASYLCKNKGGQGAVREFIEWLLSN